MGSRRDSPLQIRSLECVTEPDLFWEELEVLGGCNGDHVMGAGRMAGKPGTVLWGHLLDS